MSEIASDLRFKKLFSPFQIGRLEIKNRIIMATISTGFGTEDGYVTDKLIDYFAARARGGVGLITAGYASVEFPRGNTGARRLAIDDDKFIPGLRSIAEVIKKNGARAALQLAHAGGFGQQSVNGVRPVAPSPIVCRAGGDIPKELTVGEIQEMVALFARASERAVKAGFEAIQVHAATRYLINQFLSPATNKRTDTYGGSLENRTRFLLQIIKAIKATVGNDYPIIVKINAVEVGLRHGLTLTDAKPLAKIIEDAGCHAILVSTEGRTYVSSLAEPAGVDIPFARAIKEVVRIPVIAMGRITPEVAEVALREGKADFVAIGRALLADPELPNKAAQGRMEEITPCLGCDSCHAGLPIRCTVNASLGKERQYEIKPAQRVKKVIVVGGGPAGMEAARIAALRGHQATLYTRQGKLGGRLNLASKMPGHRRTTKLTTYLADQVKKAGVKVVLGQNVTTRLIETIKPDAVILATGSTISPIGWLVAGLIGVLAWPKLSYKGNRIRMLRTSGAKKETLGLHTMFLSVARPNQAMINELGGRVPEVYRIGDSTEPFGMMEAIADGARVGRAV